MIFEGLIEVAVPLVGRILGYVIIDLLAHIIFYFTGYTVLKVVTFGRRPENFIRRNDGFEQDYRVIFFGFIFWHLPLNIVVAKTFRCASTTIPLS